ncbi:hypothetical protein HUU53_03630, partial [Candidatus Micrarchaeota archaeon]|nr:hypothetical protein [Candidatus Micrarchaeota archaeon]
KAYASVYFAARTTHYSEQKAEDIAKKTLTQLTKHCLKKKTMTSKEIFKFITSELKKHDKEVAYMYATHMDIS